MICSIISIGTELNLGLILDVNSKYIAERVTDLGIECRYMFTVSDSVNDISDALVRSLECSDMVIINGGLGPTDDDVTKKAVASSLGLNLVRDKSLDNYSMRFVRDRKEKDIIKRLLRQSYLPEKSFPIKPRLGSASGFRIETEDGKFIICMPGVPKEMRSMFEEDVAAFLKDIIKRDALNRTGIKIRKSILLTTDISEAEVEERIKEIIGPAEKINIQIGITAEPGLIKIILVAKAADDVIADRNLKKIEKKISDRLGNYFYGKDNSLISDNLKKAISKAKDKLTISVAESMTGGLISSIITDTPGSSEFFSGGVVSYSVSSKVNLLGIKRNDIEKYGVVSEEICIEMAKKVKDIFGSDYSLSVTGFAGPGSEIIKAGLVFCGIIGPDGYEKVFKKVFPGSRVEIKFRTAQFILNELRLAIIESTSAVKVNKR
jgi:nicotinamide-nucleotide amidase